MHIFSSYAKILGETHTGVSPEVGHKQKTERKRKKKRERKLVITMARYALQRHLGWRTQSRLGQFLGLAQFALPYNVRDRTFEQ